MATNESHDTSHETRSEELPESWAETELESVEFGDTRLNKRAKYLLGSFRRCEGYGTVWRSTRSSPGVCFS